MSTRAGQSRAGFVQSIGGSSQKTPATTLRRSEKGPARLGRDVLPLAVPALTDFGAKAFVSEIARLKDDPDEAVRSHAVQAVETLSGFAALRK